MPTRATKRGSQRTHLERDCDVLICGASFAGLAVARELAGCGARVLVIDRYELGERQTSACAMPTMWMRALGLTSSLRQSFDELVVHTPHASWRWQLPWSFSTFDYRELCALLWGQAASADIEFDTAMVTGRSGHTVHTDRGELRSPLIVDALGWRRVLSNAHTIQPPNARLSRGLEVHPRGHDAEMQLWVDRRYVRAGYSWSFPARDELRVGVGSFWPEHHVKEPTVRLAGDLGLPAERYQGNWIPHQLRDAVEDGVFFAGDSAGHCLPLTAEGIRTALYFGLACGRELRSVLESRVTREHALERYGAFSSSHARKFRWLLGAQRAVARLTGTRAIDAMTAAVARPPVAKWIFNQYLDIAPPSFVGGGSHLRTRPRLAHAPA
jgi:digeranylgeranylglycerophospholipid reductase